MFRFYKYRNYFTCIDKSRVAITFDDGPTEVTPSLLKELKRLDIKATFFLVGNQITKNPQLVKQAFDAGHEIEIHDLDHSDLTSFTLQTKLPDA
jgi:peptidoglycan/xylan/chitin deacetylase (PgdA/CDA1 family)